MGKVRADQESKQPHQDPAYGVEGVIAHLSLLKSETEAIFNAPPPKKEYASKNVPMSDEGKKEGDKKTEDEAEPKDAEPEAKNDVDMNQQ